MQKYDHDVQIGVDAHTAPSRMPLEGPGKGNLVAMGS